MNGTQKETTRDILLRGLAAEGSIGVAAIDGVKLVEEARRIHGLSRVATAALGRQLMMTAMMAAELKDPGHRLSTIIKGDGSGGSMVCTGSPALEVKGTIAHPQVELPPTDRNKLDVGGLVGGNGTLTVVRDLAMKAPYVGSVELVSGEIAEDFAAYYAASQQQPSMVYLGVRVDPCSGRALSAGGLMVQPMPGCPQAVVERLAELAPEVTSLAERLEQGQPLQQFLEEVFGSMAPVLTQAGEPRYRCDCSRERIEQALIAVGDGELTAMIQEDHGAQVQCHFCDKNYRFSEADLKRLLWSAKKEEHDEQELG